MGLKAFVLREETSPARIQGGLASSSSASPRRMAQARLGSGDCPAAETEPAWVRTSAWDQVQR